MVELLSRRAHRQHRQIYQFSHKDLWKKYDFAELYPGHDGVRNYFEYVDSQLDLTRDVVFDTFAESCTWDEETRQWTARPRTARCRMRVR